MRLKIGRLARRTGTTAPTIRYYESIHLMPHPDRQQGGQRTYGEDDVKRLAFIRRCRDFGFPIEQVRRLADLLQDRGQPCVEVRDLAQAHLTEVRAKLAELHALERTIAGFVGDCDSACAGGPSGDCVILEELVDGCGVGRNPVRR
jgi:DNA-binding transcriptional MerR regulator